MAMGTDRRHNGGTFFSLRRTVTLVRACRREQSEPAAFYTPLAADSVALVQRFTTLADQRVLDVGGGPGFFTQAFENQGARYVSVDLRPVGVVCGDALALPIRDDAIDICFSSNVLEHVPNPQRMLHEMLRVTRPGGLLFLCYTNWLGPLGGHETSPWHYLGGNRAARIYEHRHGTPPANRYGTSLFALSVAQVLRWVREAEHRGHAEPLAIFPRYHPSWAHPLVRVPILREFLTANCAIALRVRSQSNDAAHLKHASRTSAARTGSAPSSPSTPATVPANVASGPTSQPVIPSRIASRSPSTS